MSSQNFGPYRATALWNEVVEVFKNGMPLGIHRHWLHKHKNSFTGREAVSFIHEALKNSKHFSPDVNRDQACQLLNQFLNAKLIRPVSNCSAPKSKNLVDSYHYLYEFTDALEKFEPRIPYSAIHSLADQKNMAIMNRDCFKFPDSGDIWKKYILSRIKNILMQLGISDVMTPESVNSMWIFINSSPETSEVKWRTGLPAWVAGAMNTFISCSNGTNALAAYHDFQIDVLNVILDYFRTLEYPVICYSLYKLFLLVFSHLERLNSAFIKQNVKMETRSTRKNLETCLETAFTSDNPITRIVPKCSTDTIHLPIYFNGTSNKVSKESSDLLPPDGKLNELFIEKPKFVTNFNEKENICIQFKEANFNRMVSGAYSNQGFCSPEGLREVHNPIPTVHRFLHGKILVPMMETPLYPNHNDQKPFQSCTRKKINEFKPKTKQWMKMKRKKKHFFKENPGICNPALSFSCDDVDAIERCELDFPSAMESLQKLIKISVNKKSFSSDDESSFSTMIESSSSSSFAPSSDDETDESGLDYEYYWLQDVAELGTRIYHLLIILLPPCNRAQLKSLLHLLLTVSPPHFSAFSQQNVIEKLGKSILRPPCEKEFNPLMTRRIISFFLNNFKTLFADLPESDVEAIYSQSSNYSQVGRKTSVKDEKNGTLQSVGKLPLTLRV